MRKKKEIGARLFILGATTSFTSVLLIALGVNMDYLFFNLIKLPIWQHIVLFVFVPAIASVMGFRILFYKN